MYNYISGFKNYAAKVQNSFRISSKKVINIRQKVINTCFLKKDKSEFTKTYEKNACSFNGGFAAFRKIGFHVKNELKKN